MTDKPILPQSTRILELVDPLPEPPAPEPEKKEPKKRAPKKKEPLPEKETEIKMITVGEKGKGKSFSDLEKMVIYGDIPPSDLYNAEDFGKFIRDEAERLNKPRPSIFSILTGGNDD